MAQYRTQSSDTDLLKYQSTETSIAELSKRGPQKRSFTLKSAVSDSHSKTVAALDAPDAPKEVANWYVYFIGVVTCFGAIAYGYGKSDRSPALSAVKFSEAAPTSSGWLIGVLRTIWHTGQSSSVSQAY